MKFQLKLDLWQGGLNWVQNRAFLPVFCLFLRL